MQPRASREPAARHGQYFLHQWESGLGAGEDDATHVGWTAGAGVEFAATENLSVDLAYRYSDYGNAEYTNSSGTGELHLKAHQVTVGLNWGF